MQHGAGGRGQDAQSPQKDEGRVEAEHRLFALQNRQRFGDAGRLYAQCVSCLRHGCRGLAQHNDMVSQAFFF